VALPIDRWWSGEEENPFGGHGMAGGGLTVWDGKDSTGRPQETRSGDVAFIDRAGGCWLNDILLPLLL